MRLTPLLAVAFVGLSSAVVSAANLGRGDELAHQWCANCHVIGSGSQQTTQQGPPSLKAIAKSGMTPDQLRTFLSSPHGKMPDLSLSRAEIDDLIAYINSLR